MIRFLTKTDLPELLSLLSQLTTVELDPGRAEVLFHLYERDHIEGRKHIIVHTDPDDKKIIGTASILIEQKFIHGGQPVGHIEDVVVDEDYRGCGVGRSLILRLLELAECQDCYKVILDCKTTIVPFYEKCGFNLVMDDLWYIAQMRINKEQYMEIINE